MISNLKKNIMGTISFDGQFDGMRKPQDFITHPIKPGDSTLFLLVQSDTRIGRIGLITGTVTMSPPRAGGSRGVHLHLAKIVGTLTDEELLLLKSHIAASASPHAGTNGIVYCDNSGAAGVMGVAA